MLRNIATEFYDKFYSPGSGWFLITLSFAVVFFFGSLGGNSFSAQMFNIIIIPWQISFLLFAFKAFADFFRTRYHAAKESFKESK